MNFKLLILRSRICITVLQALVAALGWSLFSAPVKAQNCPYDSYMIINNRCINVPSQDKPNIPLETQPNYLNTGSSDTYNNLEKPNTYNPNAKTCSEFDYQDEAQDYALKKDSNLDGDGDSIVCRSLPWRKYGYLNKSSYAAVKNEYYRRKQSQTFGFRDGITMSIADVQSIIGFPGHYIGNSTWVWGNIHNPKQQIKVKVQANQITGMRKKGF